MLAAPPILLAFGFGNLLMLGWLAAASAPLIIHLWNKRKYREMRWAAVEFLLAAMRKNARRIQIQQWLLLAVRTMLIVLIVLAMAEPFMEHMGLKFVPGARTHKLIVLDGSFSMAYRPTDASLFSRAKELAAKIVDESQQGDAFTLVLMSDPPRVIVGTPAFEPRDFIEEIESLQLPHGGGDLPATVKLVREILDRARQEHSGLDQGEVYFLTDLQRNSWAPEFAGGPDAAEEFYRHVEQAAERASLVVIDLGQAGSENLAVSDLRMAEPYATLWRDATFEAQVKNFGSQRYTRQLVELLVDDVRVKQAYVDLEPGGEASVSFSHRFEMPGHHVAAVRLSGDLLDVDNTRWLSVPVKPHLRVLCVSGQPNATYYLTNALDPDRAERSLVRPTVVSESALTELSLGQFDCIFLCNVAQFTPAEARLLESYLKQGGGLVFFLGERVIAERYNQELAGNGGGPRILPARIGEIVGESQYRFDPLDYQHPIVRPFRGREDAGLLTTPVYRYFRLSVPREWTQARTALAFSGGDPAIVEEPRYRGRVLLVAMPASLSSVDPVTGSPWTAMPAWPSFVPVVQELLAAAIGSQADQYNSQVGQTLGSPLSLSASQVPLAVVGPDGRKQTVRLDHEGDEPRWQFDAAWLSGVYRLAHRDAEPEAAPSSALLGDPLSAPVPFAVNVDIAESDLRKASADELPDGFLVQTDWQNLDREPSAQIGRRSGMHKMLLMGAFGLLLFESFLAWLIGRGMV